MFPIFNLILYINMYIIIPQYPDVSFTSICIPDLEDKISILLDILHNSFINVLLLLFHHRAFYIIKGLISYQYPDNVRIFFQFGISVFYFNIFIMFSGVDVFIENVGSWILVSTFPVNAILVIFSFLLYTSGYISTFFPCLII